ncbi:MAG: hypothetical protein Q4Q03_05785 [Bowdeniella nasicola]|nr:hypothetical protein [Bowdeniella nasicola]
MIRYDSLDQLLREQPGTVIQRIAQAYAQAPTLPVGPAFSIGDSLTYRIRAAHDDSQLLVARRDYAISYLPLDDEVILTVGQVGELECVRRYDDTTDTQLFRPTPASELEQYRIGVGEVAMIAGDEAVRVIATNGRYLQVHSSRGGAQLAHT